MNKKEQLSKLRKKLESSSRKTRRSTDLRQSLGRKSVGDLTASDLAALEQQSISSNESCHLNPDSAVIDSALLDNPDWFKKSCLQGYLASETSINAAIQQERAANIVDTSNVDELDFGSFNTRDINKILGSPNTVNQSAIDAFTGRVSLASSSSTVVSPNEDESLELPQRKPSALRRKTKRNPVLSNNVFSKALEEEQDGSKTDSPSRIRKDAPKLHQEQHTAGSDESNSDLSIELPKRKTSAFRRGKKSVAKEVQSRPNVFAKVLEETIDQNEESAGATLIEANMSLPKKSSRKSINRSSDASLSESLKPPVPKRSRLRRGVPNSQPNSKPGRNVFEDILNETSDLSEEENANKTKEQVQDNESHNSDDSLPRPVRKPSRLKRGVGLSSKVSAPRENVFTRVLEESSITSDNAGMSLSKTKEGSKLGQGTGESDHVVPDTHLKSSFVDDDSLEIPTRKITSLRRGQKQNAPATGKNKFMEILESTATSESYVEPPECDVDQASKAEMFSNLSRRKSLDELNKDEINSSPRRKLLSVRQPSTDAKENMLPSINFEEAHVDSLNNTLESLPLGAEANNYSGGMQDPDNNRRFKLSLTRMSSTNTGVDKTSRFPGSTKKSDAAIMLNVELPNRSNVSNLSSSITDHTRDAPRRASSIVSRGFIKTPDMNLNQTSNQRASKNYGNSSNVSYVSIIHTSKQRNSLLADKEIALPESDVLVEEAPLSVSLSSDVISPKNAALHSRELINASSSMRAKASTPPNGERNSSVGNILSTSSMKIVSKSQQGPIGDAGDDSDAPDNSSASSCNENDEGSDDAISSIAGNEVSEDDAGDGKGSESSLSICSAKTSIAPPSAFASISTPAYAVPTPPSTEASSLTEKGSDSVFKSNETGTSSNGTEASKRVSGKQMNESWPENPFVDVPQGSGLGRGTSETYSTPRISEQVNLVEGVPSSLTSLHDEGHSSLQSMETIRTDVNPSFKSTTSATAPGSDRASHASGPSVRLPAASLLSYQQRLQPSKRKLSEQDMEKMRAGMANWFENIKKNKTVIEGKPLPVFKKPDPVKKPESLPSKRPVKKNKSCPWFGDYKAPRRVKPKPYVTAKMYKFLEKKLQPKFGLEYRVKAEEFVTFMCQQVSLILKKKLKYHSLVLQLRKKMYSLGLISTQFEFYLFIEDYLPDAFREKSIPCYGSTKAPPFDPNDIHKDLSDFIV